MELLVTRPSQRMQRALLERMRALLGDPESLVHVLRRERRTCGDSCSLGGHDFIGGYSEAAVGFAGLLCPAVLPAQAPYRACRSPHRGEQGGKDAEQRPAQSGTGAERQERALEVLG